MHNIAQIKQKISRCFAAAAHSYDAAAGLQQMVGNHLFDKLVTRTESAPIILDLGAGTGYFSQLLAERYGGSQVIAVDIALPMLKVAKQRSVKKPVIFCGGDFDYLPLPTQWVDVVFANMSLQWSLNLSTTLQEIHRVLKPGGLLIFSTLGAQTLSELRTCWQSINDDVHTNRFLSAELLNKALQQNNFSQDELKVENMQRSYATVYQLMKNLKAIGANYVPDKKNSTLSTKSSFAQLAAAYERYRNSAGLLLATYEVIYVVATRS